MVETESPRAAKAALRREARALRALHLRPVHIIGTETAVATSRSRSLTRF